MIQIDEIRQLPRDIKLAGSAVQEAVLAGENITLLEKHSTAMWKVSLSGEPILICGVVQESLLSDVFFWFMMCEGFTRKLKTSIRSCRDLVLELKERFPRLVTSVNVEDVAAHRFAKALRWKPEPTTYELMGTTYQQYRMN